MPAFTHKTQAAVLQKKDVSSSPTEEQEPALAKLGSEQQPCGCVMEVAWYNAHASEGASVHLLPSFRNVSAPRLGSRSPEVSTI